MYRFKDHTADIKLYVEERDCEKAVEDLLNALCEILEGRGMKRIKRGFSYKGKYEEEFIVGLIEDFLYNVEENRIIPKRVKLKKIEYDKFYVEYEVEGEEGIPENIIKAATFHNLKIKKEEKCVIEVVLDV